MNDAELDRMLKSAPVPEPRAGFWEEFPGEVSRAARARSTAPGRGLAPSGSRPRFVDGRRPGFGLALGFGLAILCLLGAFWLGYWRGRDSGAGTGQIVRMQKYLSEVSTLFPNRVRAIQFDGDGVHLLLAPEADVPDSPAVYVKICGPEGCRQFITFSGQQIRLNGEVCDVLVDHKGGVLLVGTKMAWSAGEAVRQGPYRVEARLL
jgi:hypothetical protein